MLTRIHLNDASREALIAVGVAAALGVALLLQCSLPVRTERDQKKAVAELGHPGRGLVFGISVNPAGHVQLTSGDALMRDGRQTVGGGTYRHE